MADRRPCQSDGGAISLQTKAVAREERNKKGRRETACGNKSHDTVFSGAHDFRRAVRFLTFPFPPRPFAALFFAAFILPPLLFFAIRNPFGCCVLTFVVTQDIARRVVACPWGITLPRVRGGCLKGETHAEPGHAVKFCFARPHRADVQEYSHMPGQSIFQAGPRLAEPHFHRV